MRRAAIRLIAFVALAPVSLAAADAHACRTWQGQRAHVTYALNGTILKEVSALTFAPKARLFTGGGALADIKGIVGPQHEYFLQVKSDSKGWTFDLRGANGSTGTLRLAKPAEMESFVIDPRDDARADGPDGQGPVLYKEWRLSARARGTGAFASGARGGHRITLVLHGRGNRCTTSRDFSHWTLEMRGDVAQYHLFGELVRAGYPKPAE